MENTSIPDEIVFADPIGNEEYDDKQYSKFRLKALHWIESVPANGYVGTFSKSSPLKLLRERLAEAVDVPTTCIFIAYEGRELSDDLTMKENSVIEPGPAARKRGAKIELQFALKESTVPGAVVKAQEAEKQAEAEKLAIRQAEETRLRVEREQKERAVETAKRKAEEDARQREVEDLEYGRLLRRQPLSMKDKVRFQCVEVSEDAGKQRGIIVEMPQNGLVGQFARHIHEVLGIDKQTGIAIIFGVNGRLTGKEQLDEIDIKHNTTVPFQLARDPSEAVRPAVEDSVWREPLCYPFENAMGMESARATACATEFMKDFHRTAGWPYKPPEEEQREVPALTVRQLEGITAVRNSCREPHFEAVQKMTERAESLGFSELDFVKALEWVRELAPIIVHVDLAEFGEMLAKDTHYRNQFEVNKSRGGLNHHKMIEVENQLFGYAYDRGEGAERVKYGVLNFANNPTGIKSCKGYGEDYLVLKGVRLRTTLCSDDTWRETELGTPDYYAHIFERYKDNEFRAALQLARDKKVPKGCEDITDGQYKEVQIHGEIRLRDHISKIVVHEGQRGNRRVEQTLPLLQQACGNCEVLWMDSEADMERASFVPKSLREIAYMNSPS